MHACEPTQAAYAHHGFEWIMLAFPAIPLSPVVCHLPRLSPYICRMHKTFISVGELFVFVHIVQLSMRLAVQA